MTNIIAAPSILITKLTEKTLDQLDRVSWVTVIPDSLSCCVRTIFTSLDIFYHGFQWSVRSLPLAVKLTFNQIPVGLVKRISSNIPEPSRHQTLIHATNAKKGINSLLASAQHSYSHSKHAISLISTPSNSSSMPLGNLVNLPKSRTVLELGVVSLAIFSVIGLSKYNGGLLQGLSISTDQGQGWSSITVAGLGSIAVITAIVSALFHVSSTEMKSQLTSQTKVIAELDKENNRLKDEIKKLRFNRKLVYKYESLVEGFKKLKDEYDKLEIDRCQKSRYINNLKDQLIWIQGEVSRLRTKIQQLMSTNNDLITSRKESQFDPNAILVMTEQQERLFDDLCEKLSLKCSLCQGPFENPVSLVNGQTYSKSHIDVWLNGYSNIDPNTRGALPLDLSLIPNNIVDFLTTMVRIRAALANPEKEDPDKLMKELPLIEIEEPVLVIKTLSEALPVGITISKADALSVIPNAEVDGYIIPNLILQSYNDQLRSYFNVGNVISSGDHNGISEPVVIPVNDHKAIRNQRLKYLSNQQPW